MKNFNINNYVQCIRTKAKGHIVCMSRMVNPKGPWLCEIKLYAGDYISRYETELIKVERETYNVSDWESSSR